MDSWSSLTQHPFAKDTLRIGCCSQFPIFGRSKVPKSAISNCAPLRRLQSPRRGRVRSRLRRRYSLTPQRVFGSWQFDRGIRVKPQSDPSLRAWWTRVSRTNLSQVFWWRRFPLWFLRSRFGLWCYGLSPQMQARIRRVDAWFETASRLVLAMNNHILLQPTTSTEPLQRSPNSGRLRYPQ